MKSLGKISIFVAESFEVLKKGKIHRKPQHFPLFKITFSSVLITRSPPLCHKCFEHATLCVTIVARKLQRLQFSEIQDGNVRLLGVKLFPLKTHHQMTHSLRSMKAILRHDSLYLCVEFWAWQYFIVGVNFVYCIAERNFLWISWLMIIVVW